MNQEEIVGTPTWPWALPDEQELAYAATIAATITNGKTILTFDTLTGDATLNLTISPDLRNGSVLILIVPASTGGYDLTCNTGFGTTPNIVGVTGKTKTQAFELIGGKFNPIAAPFQIN